MKILSLACAGLFLSSLMLAAVLAIISRKKKELQKKLLEAEEKITSQAVLIRRLERTIELKERIKNETEQKINSLHSGDAVGNAIDILRRRTCPES